MTYHDQWKALSSRIRGLMQAGELHARFLNVNSGDPHGVAKRLRVHCEGVLGGLQSFRKDFAHSLPPAVIARIVDFYNQTDALIADTSGAPGLKQERVRAALVLLGAFETELTFLLSDTQEFVRARSERAFSHLQRSIVVDPEFREKWKAAFEDGEIACEKLGAVHLLLHGIWAFKVNAAGARTDLVFQEPVEDLTDEQGYADGIVLTEWKKAPEATDAEESFCKARAQAKLYALGALAGSELTGYRYAVVVSRKQVVVPADVVEDGVIYRHINIVVEPVTPSRA